MVCSVFYRFDEDGSYTNPVICVYVECDHNVCIFKSVLTNNLLPIAVSSSMLHSDDSCRANFVEIIHDCMPRRVDLDLIFASNGNNELYLQVCSYATIDKFLIRIIKLVVMLHIYVPTYVQMYSYMYA